MKLWVVRRVLRIEQRPSDPAGSGIGADGAEAAVERFVERGRSAHDADVQFEPSTANSIDPFVEGREFYPRILADIEQASSIHILMFGWKPGTWGDRFADALLERLRAGAEVRIVVDSFGSRPYGSSRDLFTKLVDAGAQMVVNDVLPPVRDGLFPSATTSWRLGKIGRSDHRKLMVFDGKVMWTGGAGIEDHFENGEFHDVMVRLTGAIVPQAQAVFAMAFAGHGGPIETTAGWFVEPEDRGSISSTIGQVVPGGWVTATHAARNLVSSATHRLDIVNPYLTDTGMISQIIEAGRRGVAVRIVASERSNNLLASMAFRHRTAELLDAGVEIWHYPDAVVHAKLIVSDQSVQFGTLNLDAWALYRNFEFAVVTRDSDTSTRFVEGLVAPAVARSKRIEEPATGLARWANALASKMSYVL